MANSFGPLSFFSIIAVFITVVLFAGTVSLQLKKANSARNRFGINLFSELSKQNAENLIFSPFSVAVSLSMVYQGSEGNTRQQLRSVLGEKFVKSNSSQMLKSIYNHERYYKLNTANALLSSESVLESYKNKLVSQFGAELFGLKGPKTNLKLINEWCSKKTNGKINKFLDKPPSPDTLMVLLNAIYFKDAWSEPFDEKNTKKRFFYGVDNKTSNVPFMKKEETLNVVHLNKTNSTMIEFSYNLGDVSFYAIHSDRNVITATDIELLPESLDYFWKHRIWEKATVTIPKFKVDSRFDLVKPVAKLGISDIFNANAQLKGISSSSLFISAIEQKATIEVNEKGSEAAAITQETSVGAGLGMEPIPVTSYIFDRPFLFVIYHRPSANILFVGRINSF